MVRLVISMLALSFGACADDESEPATCPNDLPASCPADVPSYQNDIAPIIANRCFPCHTTGGVAAAAHDFTDYPGVFQDRVTILNQVYGCKMPPPEAPAPTLEERGALLAWLVCHAPDN